MDASLCAKVCANVRHSYRLKAIKSNFKMAPAAMLDFSEKRNLKVRLSVLVSEPHFV